MGVILECRCALSSYDFNSPKTSKSLRQSHSSRSFVFGSVKSDLVRIIIMEDNTNTRDFKGFAEHVVRENGPDIILNVNFRYRYETREKSKHFTDLVLVLVFEIRAHRRRCTWLYKLFRKYLFFLWTEYVKNVCISCMIENVNHRVRPFVIGSMMISFWTFNVNTLSNRKIKTVCFT